MEFYPIIDKVSVIYFQKLFYILEISDQII
jgi:hypothetical protein